MKSSATASFWKAYSELPDEIQKAARKQSRLWQMDSRHPSLQFKKVGPFWSARITDNYRSLALLEGGVYFWFWIGTHAEYDFLLRKR